MKYYLSFFVSVIAAAVFTASCTKDIDIKLPPGSQQIVVEGVIESGMPPYVILSRSFDIFGAIDANEVSQYFVHGAEMWVDNGTDTTQLVEWCLNDLPLDSAQQAAVLGSFGFVPCEGCPLPEICIYTVPDIVNYFLGGSVSFKGEERTRYNLRIFAEGKVITSSTYIPTALGIDSLSYKEAAVSEGDSLVSVYVHLTFPDTTGNYIRYWTQRNDEPFYVPRTGSVYEDKLVVGQSIALPIERAQHPNDNIDFKTFSYFWRGDSVQVKWANIDSRTFDFFYTLESDGGGSPFASYVRVKSNVTGGFGVFAGYATRYYSIYIPHL